MRKFGGLVVVAVVGVLLATPNGANAAGNGESAAGDGGRPDAEQWRYEPIEERVQADLGLREQLHFNADRDEVRALIERARSGDPQVEVIIGTALTESEARELRIRLQLQDEVVTVDEYGRNRAAGEYAGLFIDHSRGGVAVALFTANLDRHREALAGFSMPDRLVLSEARHSLAALEALVLEISDDMPKLRNEGVDITSVALEVNNNRIGVQVASDVSHAQGYFDKRYGRELVAVEPATLTGLSAALSGGSPIRNTTQGGDCTVGFSYRNSANGYGFFTAGHCGYGGDGWRSLWYTNQNYVAFGSVEGGGSFPARGSDSSTIPAPYADTTNTSGWVTISSAASLHDDQVGATVCFYGATTGTQRCGTVQNKSYTHYGCGSVRGCTTVYDTRLVNMGCGNGPLGGDSGGPVYNSSGKGFGLVRGWQDSTSCGRQFLVYTHVQYAMQHWGVTIPR